MSRLLTAGALLASAGIFGLEWYFDAHGIVQTLYVFPVVWVALWSSPHFGRAVVIVAAATSSLLLWGVTPRCGMICIIGSVPVLTSIWLTALLSLLRKRMERTARSVDFLAIPCQKDGHLK